MSADVTQSLHEDDHAHDSPDLTPGPRPDPQHGGPDEAEEGVTAEAKLFVRMAIFGIATGIAYWFLTYETAGTVMLTAFGGASALAALAIWLGSRSRRGAGREAKRPIGASLGADVQPVPRPGWAPLGIAVGLGGVALAGPFGPWLAIAGLFLAIRSAKSWLDAQMEETESAQATERGSGDPGRGQRRTQA